jgi:hypothetical protein
MLPVRRRERHCFCWPHKAAFLDPANAEIPAEATPDSAATRAMLVKIVNYVNTALGNLPNLIASRETTGFEAKPPEDVQEMTAVVSPSSMPLHFVEKSLAMVTYRDRKEVVDNNVAKSAKQRAPIGGLTTTGEFGPILSMVLGEALKAKLPGPDGNRIQAEKLQCSTTRSRVKYRTIA